MLSTLRHFAIRLLRLLLLLIVMSSAAFLLARDVYIAPDLSERVRSHTVLLEFDFIDWTLKALGVKLQQASLDQQHYLTTAPRAKLVRQYFDLRAKLDGIERTIRELYTNPDIADPDAESAGLRLMEADVRAQMAKIQPLAEAILQEQVAAVSAQQGLAVGGQPFPPVAFRFTPLPLALIISPRDEIKQATTVMLNGELPLAQQIALEERVTQKENLSTLVTPVGGIGTYPAMVAQSRDLYWIAATTAHEWVHNFLTLHPLGVLYDANGEMRTMNETTAEIAGNELGALVIAQYYSDLVRPSPGFRNLLQRFTPAPTPETPPPPDAFDFRAEMHATRLRVDELLAAQKIDEAETYMEERRQFFWDNGYQIRKLNQAYFAFYGAYAASGGGGAQGVDPVGPAVQLVRRRSANLAEFLNTMAWFTSFEDLQQYLYGPAGK